MQATNSKPEKRKSPDDASPDKKGTQAEDGKSNKKLKVRRFEMLTVLPYLILKELQYAQKSGLPEMTDPSSSYMLN